MKIVIGSLSPVKIAAVQKGFGALFPESVFELVPVKAVSGVSEQPMSSVE